MLRSVPGLADVNGSGGYEKQIVVLPKPEKLAVAGITFSELAKVLSENTENAGGGVVNVASTSSATSEPQSAVGGNQSPQASMSVRASSTAASARSATNAFSAGFNRSSRASVARITSTGDASRRRTAAAIS
jgi:cobalt-zinc-cadmium resistance protein CzcA